VNSDIACPNPTDFRYVPITLGVHMIEKSGGGVASAYERIDMVVQPKMRATG
jgi:hypothetical protein